MAEVILKNISKVYEDGFKAVDNINLVVADKEFVVLVGPSGCGKSTTLRMIAGLEDISDGELSIGGTLVNELPPQQRDIAMVFQNYALYPHMTVRQNMAFGLKMRKMPKDEINTRVEKAGNTIGLEKLMNKKPGKLSGGQRQRVALGRAIVRNPKVFLFDEPLSNLDAKLRVSMRLEIAKLHKKLEATTIYVTHDQTEAMTMADRIVLMKDGIIQQIDSPINMFNKPINKFVAGFIGSPQMNFLDGKIEGSNFIGENNVIKISLPSEFQEKLKDYEGKKITMGVRPKDIKHVIEDDSDIQSYVAYNTSFKGIEPMGNETFLYFSMGDNEWVARVSPDSVVVDNDTVYLNSHKLHFFDFESEKTL
ncbi:MAG: sn-glycerol-3-phosphate ABC transporter ATP-binding protein UgpC [Cyclobacteriaceae bacterium]|nr:sn-glycerol-3-phosphate ABC transporter ATP-binding protein UgpC [Cyclobacteriaceae bacterium]